MPVTTEKDLPENLRAVWLKAMSAMELKNYAYAAQLYSSIVRAHPEFLLARQLARKAALAKNAGKKNLLGGLSGSPLSTLKIQPLIKKDPLAAIDALEKILENDPANVQANTLLKEAALAANLPDIAEFALETIIEVNPKDTKTMHELARLYMAHDKPEKAVDMYARITRVAPHDLAAVKGGKDAAAAVSMKRGGWDKEQTDYRDLIKNKEEAVALEQQSRVVRSEEMIERLLAELHVKVEAEPQNIDASRRIAELYEQKEDLENAIAWYQYAAAITNNTDPTLVRKASELRTRQFDKAIADFEAYIANHAGTPEAETARAQLEDLRRQRAEHLLEEARKRVERNPTDLMARFELGETLMKAGHFKEAIPELQKARQNPAVRLKAMNLLGRCYTERGMYDLAADTLLAAASELHQMDDIKKAIVYDLGLVYEKMGQAEKSIECMKQIYAVDYGYRDVAERVERSYAETP